LLKLGAVDAVVPEKNLMAGLKKLIVSTIKELKKLPVEELLDRRYAKLTAMGRFA
jgi:acetyl-CoA carboxylase alpha subunit